MNLSNLEKWQKFGRMIGRAIRAVKNFFSPQRKEEVPAIAPMEKIFVDPKIMTLTDTYGPIGRGLVRDSTASLSDIYQVAGRAAIEIAVAHTKQTGVAPKLVTVRFMHWCLNRMITAEVDFEMAYDDVKKSVSATVSKGTRQRYVDTSQAMNSFLN